MNKRKRKGILALILIIFLCCDLNWFPTRAASANVTIALSASSVSIGKNVTATVSISGSDISAYTIYVTYNSGVLQYNSSSGSALANGGGGTLTISGTGAGSVSLSFTAIANGTCYIGTSGDEVLNINGEALSVSHAGVNVTVATPQQGDNEKTTETTESKPGDSAGGGSTEKTTEEKTDTEEDLRSSNCNLSALQISPGILEPSFAPSVTSYSVQLDENVTSIVVSATPEDEKASTQVSGASSLVPGENSVRITVTAENGAVKVYRIHVMVGEELGEATVTMDDILYKFVNEENGLEVPDGYSSVKVTYKDWEVLAFESPNQKLLLVCLLDEDGNNGWYIYRQDTGEFLPYQEYSANYNRYVILTLPEGEKLPEGYRQTEVVIGGIKYEAYQTEEFDDADLYLIYAMNIEAEEGFYFYDAKEGAFLRYVPPAEIVATMTEAATATEATPTFVPVDPAPKKGGFFTKKHLWYMVYGTGGLALLFLFLMIGIASKNRKLKEEVKDADEMISHLAQANDSVNHKIMDKLGDNKSPEAKPETDQKTDRETDSETESISSVTEIPTVELEPKKEEKAGIILPFSGKPEDAEKKKQDGEQKEKEESREREEKEKPREQKEETSSEKEEVLSDGEQEQRKLMEKKKNYEELAKEAKELSDRMKDNYDASMDSAFADSGEKDE